jgi:hypothetical protein
LSYPYNRPLKDQPKSDHRPPADPAPRQCKDPPYPCKNCGANHWMMDCPQATQSSNAPKQSYAAKVQKAKTPPTKYSGPATGVNVTPIGSSKWPHPIFSNQTKASPLSNEVTYSPTDMDNTPSAQSSLASLHKSVTPVYAQIALNHGAILHVCCIDTGSGISLMDASYQKKFLSHIKVQPHPSFQIQGIGRSLCAGWIEIEVTFSTTAKPVSIPVSFYIVPTLDANILIGTDFLHHASAIIDIGKNLLRLGGHPGKISVNCKHEVVKDDTLEVWAMQSYIVLPGHVARVPVAFNRMPTTDLALFQPKPIHRDHLRVARSVHTVVNTCQCVQVMNAGRCPLSIQFTLSCLVD